jgi:hypothetical protein
MREKIITEKFLRTKFLRSQTDRALGIQGDPGACASSVCLFALIKLLFFSCQEFMLVIYCTSREYAHTHTHSHPSSSFNLIIKPQNPFQMTESKYQIHRISFSSPTHTHTEINKFIKKCLKAKSF